MFNLLSPPELAAGFGRGIPTDYTIRLTPTYGSSVPKKIGFSTILIVI